MPSSIPLHTKAIVNSIGDGTGIVSHDPIPEIGCPGMTMDLPVLENAEMMGEISDGAEVTLMLVKGTDGMYAIGAMMSNLPNAGRLGILVRSS